MWLRHSQPDYLGQAALRAEPGQLSLAARARLVCGREGQSAHWCGDRKQSTLWELSNLNPFGGEKGTDTVTGHETQKPVELRRRPIENHTERGGLVFDPFLGSGTTLIAAEDTGRICYGLELSPVYVDVIVERWQKLTGGAALLAEDGRTSDELREARSQAEGIDAAA